MAAFLPAPPLLPRVQRARARTRMTAPARPARQAAAAPALSQYDQLAKMTTIVEDTGEIEQIRAHRPFAATTNPSLVKAAAALPEYAHLVDEAVAYGRGAGASAGGRLASARNKLFTLFGAQILGVVPGDVSTEVDARLSFDVEAQVATGLEIVRLYEEVGVAKERVLIKLATTWEGVQACRELERAGVRTNMTLLFGFAQAVAAAEAGAYLISPFVGRILDWHKKSQGVDGFAPEEDPGVLSVRKIYNFYKCAGYDTIVMGASFRNVGEILALAGCDRLTIAPKFIEVLKANTAPVPRILDSPTADVCADVGKLTMEEKEFRWLMAQDPMATEKLAEGIRGFAADLETLDRQLERLM